MAFWSESNERQVNRFITRPEWSLDTFCSPFLPDLALLRYKQPVVFF